VTLEQSALAPDLPAGLYALLTVSDTGCGMTAEVQQHLFEPFFTTKDVGQGTGLSLAAVYGIVQQHQGNLRVRSQRGEGTTFRIYLPLLADGAETAEPPKPPMPGAAGSETILLVDDEPLVRGWPGMFWYRWATTSWMRRAAWRPCGSVQRIRA